MHIKLASLPRIEALESGACMMKQESEWRIGCQGGLELLRKLSAMVSADEISDTGDGGNSSGRSTRGLWQQRGSDAREDAWNDLRRYS